MQFGGHHLAIHASVGGDTISTTPLFSGVEPVSFTYESTEYAPLAETVAGSVRGRVRAEVSP